MRIDVAVNGLWVIAPRLARVLVWTVFVTAHLVLVVFVLVLLWCFQVSPASLQTQLAGLFPQSRLATIAEVATFLGVSAFGALWLYAKAWRWLLHKLLSEFLFAR